MSSIMILHVSLAVYLIGLISIWGFLRYQWITGWQFMVSEVEIICSFFWPIWAAIIFAGLPFYFLWKFNVWAAVIWLWKMTVLGIDFLILKIASSIACIVHGKVG